MPNGLYKTMFGATELRLLPLGYRSLRISPTERLQALGSADVVKRQRRHEAEDAARQKSRDDVSLERAETGLGDRREGLRPKSQYSGVDPGPALGVFFGKIRDAPPLIHGNEASVPAPGGRGQSDRD